MYTNPFNENMTYPQARTVFFTVIDQYRNKPELEQLKEDYKQIVSVATKHESENYRSILTNGMV